MSNIEEETAQPDSFTGDTLIIAILFVIKFVWDFVGLPTLFSTLLSSYLYFHESFLLR